LCQFLDGLVTLPSLLFLFFKLAYNTLQIICELLMSLVIQHFTLIRVNIIDIYLNSFEVLFEVDVNRPDLTLLQLSEVLVVELSVTCIQHNWLLLTIHLYVINVL
jgi:hypothetical protein